MSEPKQVIVMRTKYPDGKGGVTGVRKGKLCAQAAHSSMKVFFDEANFERDDAHYGRMTLSMNSALYEWSSGASFAKIVVYVDSEEELLEIYEAAAKAGLPRALVQDAGRTEFGGKPTYTSVAVGPAYPEDIDPITGHLPLL